MPKLAREVYIAAVGMCKFGNYSKYGPPENMKTSRDLWQEAYIDLMEHMDNKVDIQEEVECLFLGNFSSDLFEKQGHLAPLMAELLGLNPKPAMRLEDACVSGGIAIRQAVIAVASGFYDTVIAGGVEKMCDLTTAGVTDTLAAAADAVYEYPYGATFPGLYANIATAHMAKYGTTEYQLHCVGIKNHNNGKLNPKAQMQMTIRDMMEKAKKKAEARGKPIPEWEDEHAYLNDLSVNPMIAYPLRLNDCSLVTDGAAMLIITTKENAKKYTDNPVQIIGSGQGSDALALHSRKDRTGLLAARTAAAEAYKMAGVGPKDIQIAEVHDCFTIAEIVAMEDLGFFEKGQAAKAVEEGITQLDGQLPINTSGGLKSKGHPVGASGIGQVVEIFKQLRGEAEGARQVKDNPKIGLCHNVGGSGGSCTIHILKVD
ncbi:MAG: thiolase C-terminal domain-containing protein [Candidatus Helarchaeales archaeon]